MNEKYDRRNTKAMKRKEAEKGVEKEKEKKRYLGTL